MSTYSSANAPASILSVPSIAASQPRARPVAHASAQVWISPRLVLCCVPPAAGGLAHLAVVVGGDLTQVVCRCCALLIPHVSFSSDTSYTLEHAIAFESPQVTSVAPKNSPMYGGFFVTLLGRHFGHIDTTVRHAAIITHMHSLYSL
jgi:hypothetical protein